jgi:uncharacterized protein
MRLTIILRSLPLILLLIAGSSASVVAQTGYPQRSPYGYPPAGYPPQQQAYRDPRAYPPGYYPGKLVQPAQPQQGFSIRRLFGVQDEPAPPTRKPVAKPRKPAPPPVALARQERAKTNPTAHVVVFGDTLADFASQGLDEMFSEIPDVAVVRKTRGESDLVRNDPADWPKFIKETLDAGQKATVAVVMLGANDRQSIKDGEESHDLLSDRWKSLYRQRVDAIVQALKERAIPVIWVGLPPMKSNKLSEDLLAMNEIYRESVQRLGGTYVDIWPGFVDEENRYTAIGPDVDGEPVRLRTNDGVLFTKPGASKVAHFAGTEIKRLIEAGQPGPSVAAVPQPADGASQAGAAAPTIEASLPAMPDVAAPVSLPTKPLVGPVLPLTRPDVTPGGALLSGAPKLNGDQAYPVRRALRNGVAPSSRPGRADDFRWPPS